MRYLLPFLLLLAACGPDREARDVTDQFKLSGDYEVTLWAESPQFFNPTNIDVDQYGRVWVAEAVNYRDFNNAEPINPPYHEDGDRIIILEDTDGDGVSDKSEVFVQEQALRAPLGVAVVGKHVYVSSSPSMIRYTDEDGDEAPDHREVFLTGFGGYDHDHGLHSLVAGPDGRLYFNTGNAGPHIVTDQSGWTLRSGSTYTGGTPYNTRNEGRMVSDDGRIWVGGLALRIEPDGTDLTVLAHNFRNAYELAVDSYGNLWQNDNDDQVLTCRTTWLMENGNTGFFSADGTRYWQADHRPEQSTFTAHWRQDDPGVQPAGDNYGAGSPTGITVYEGDAFGPEFRGMLLSAEAGRNVIYAYHTEPNGAGFDLHRTELISSLAEADPNYIWDDPAHVEDLRKWFRPSDVAVGPDGSIYVADWYDPVVGGHQSKDGEVYGRIYRITPKGQTLTTPTFDLETTAGQIKALKNPSPNVRSLGFSRLQAQGEAVLDDVKTLLDAENPYHRARAVWLMAHLGPSGIEEIRALLEHDEANLRITGYRALRQVQDQSQILEAARLLADDPSPAVRREVAISLRDVSFEQSRDLIVELARGYNGQDRWYLEALGTAADGKEEVLYPILRRALGERPDRWTPTFAGIAWRLHPKVAIEDLKARATLPDLSESDRQQALTALAFVDDPKAAEAMRDLTEREPAELATQAAWWLQYRRGNDWHAYPAAQTFEQANLADAAPDERLLDLRDAVADTLRLMDERVAAASTLAGDPAGGKLLIQLLSEVGGFPYQISSVIQTALFQNPDPSVRTLAANYFEPPELAVAAVPDLSHLSGNAERGQQTFTQSCGTCHMVEGEGQMIGPDLTFISRKFDRTELLDAIVNPSAAITFGYEPWLIETQNGAVYSGFLLADGETVVLRDVAGERHTFEADAITSRQVLSVSLMPAPNGLGLNEQDLADIIAYLYSVQAQPSGAP